MNSSGFGHAGGMAPAGRGVVAGWARGADGVASTLLWWISARQPSGSFTHMSTANRSSCAPAWADFAVPVTSATRPYSLTRDFLPERLGPALRAARDRKSVV